MSKVFIVTEGSYSDYHVITAFSTREKAEEWLEIYDRVGTEKWYGKPEIEEYDLDDPPKQTIITTIYMQQDGNLCPKHKIYKQVEDITSAGFKTFDSWNHADYYCLIWGVDTEDEKTAIKVVNEKRTQILALNLWGKHRECWQLFHGTETI